MDKLKPISYHKWDKHDINKLYNSMRNILQIEQPQLYYPIMSLFFYIHNTSLSHKVIDYKRHNYFIHRKNGRIICESYLYLGPYTFYPE